MKKNDTATNLNASPPRRSPSKRRKPPPDHLHLIRDRQFDRQLTVAEVAAVLRVSQGAIYNRLYRKEAPELRPVKVMGRWRIPESALRQVLGETPP